MTARYPSVELVVDADCPNAAEARATIRLALAVAGLPPRWSERVQPPATEPETGRLPSPTVLVDGEDVGGATPREAACRVYQTADGLAGAPPLEAVVHALRRRRDR